LSSFAEFGRFPSCLVRASRYIKEHSQSGDLIQDSSDDRNLLVGALAERQDFAVRWMYGQVLNGPKGLQERLDDLASFRTTTDESELMAFAKKNRIAWYLLRPETDVFWPLDFQQKFAFECGGYRVYQFPASSS
jgi:hypothetical protein